MQIGNKKKRKFIATGELLAHSAKTLSYSVLSSLVEKIFGEAVCAAPGDNAPIYPLPLVRPVDVKNVFTFFYFVTFFTFLTFFYFFKKTLAKFRAASRLTRNTFKITATK